MSCPGLACEHDADHGQPDGSDGAGVAHEIPCQASIAADPGQGSFDAPALGQYDEFVQLIALTISNTQRPVLAAARGAGSLIAGIGEDALDEGGRGSGCADREPNRAPSRS